jgi:hypothetical protein
MNVTHRRAKLRQYAEAGAVPLLATLLVLPGSGHLEPAPGVTTADSQPAPAVPATPAVPAPPNVDGSLPDVSKLTLPELPADDGSRPASTAPSVSGPLGIPEVVSRAYRNAESRMLDRAPACRLSWPLLAAIGEVESGHARGGRVDGTGKAVPAILGPVLDGAPGFAAVPDTDNGVYDGDIRWDRAVGPMQFIPSTWRAYAADGNDDGVYDPDNVYDATLAAGTYLCAGGEDLATDAGEAHAVFRYNHSDGYVRTVLSLAARYASGVHPVAAPPGPASPVPRSPTAPPQLPATVEPPAPTTTPPAETSPATPPATTPPADLTTTPPTEPTGEPPGCSARPDGAAPAEPPAASTTMDSGIACVLPPCVPVPTAAVEKVVAGLLQTVLTSPRSSASAPANPACATGGAKDLPPLNRLPGQEPAPP